TYPHARHHPKAVLARSGHGNVSGRTRRQYGLYRKSEPVRRKRDQQYVRGSLQHAIGTSRTVDTAVQEQSLDRVLKRKTRRQAAFLFSPLTFAGLRGEPLQFGQDR